MTKLLDVEPIPSDLSDRLMTFTLSITGEDNVTFRSCEILGRGFRNRVSFTDAEPNMIEDVLVSRLANAIKSCLHALPAGTHILSLPDFLVEIPGLALYGVRVMVQEAKEGVRNAILRFKEFIGAINHAFLNDIGLQAPHAAHAEKLAVNVLAEVCLPILNLSHSITSFDLGHDQRKKMDMSDKLREFEFQTELLKRFIFNAGTGYAEPSAQFLENTQIYDQTYLMR